MKFFKISLCFIIIISIFTITSFALSASTYADLSPTASQVQNLVSAANNYSSFINSDYVVFQDSQYSYRIVWGDIELNGSRVTSENVDVISYTRNGSGASYTWSYAYDDSEALTLTVNNLVVSNIDGLGASSPTYEDYKYHHIVKWLLIFVLAFVGVQMFLAFRRTFR